MRDTTTTKQKLIEAVGAVLAEHGFQKLGVNAVAKAAGVDKVLIYRYFDGLPNLVSAFAKSADFWPGIDELLGDIDPQKPKTQAELCAALGDMCELYVRAIRRRPLTLEILAWETVERNELTIPFESIREEVGQQLSCLFEQHTGTKGDLQATFALFSAAINYLAVRARKIKRFVGVPIDQDQGWKQLITAMRTMIDATFGD